MSPNRIDLRGREKYKAPPGRIHGEGGGGVVKIGSIPASYVPYRHVNELPECLTGSGLAASRQTIKDQNAGLANTTTSYCCCCCCLCCTALTLTFLLFRNSCTFPSFNHLPLLLLLHSRRRLIAAALFFPTCRRRLPLL